MPTVIITTLAGEVYSLTYENYMDLARLVEKLDDNFHPSFQRLLREDGTEIYPAGLARQPELDNGEHTRLLMVNTVWTSVSKRHNENHGPKYVLTYGHHPNESGMYQYEMVPTYSASRLNWKVMTNEIRQDVERTGWPVWQKETAVSALVDELIEIFSHHS